MAGFWGVWIGQGRTGLSGQGRTGGGRGRGCCSEGVEVEENETDWEDGCLWEGWTKPGAGANAVIFR